MGTPDGTPTRAGVRYYTIRQGKSVRAGTDQATLFGARAGRAVRRENCQVGNQSMGPSVAETARAGASGGLVSESCEHRKHTHSVRSGAKVLATVTDGLARVPSATSQLSW